MSKPIIYQLIPRLFNNPCEHCVPDGTIKQNGAGKMNDISMVQLHSLKRMGITHVWYTGIIQHALATDYSAYGINRFNPNVVKGKAGSPYAISDYYDIDPDIATVVDLRHQEFNALVKRTHKAEMKVIVDFVPNHVARQYQSKYKAQSIADLGEKDDKTVAFSPNNNFYYLPGETFERGNDDERYQESPAKATGNDCFTASPSDFDWYETVKLNYGIDYSTGTRHFDPIPPTWNQMLRILKYWVNKGVDGFRCDMAHMVPVEFWQWAIEQVRIEKEDVLFIAELYDPSLYWPFINAGFDYLYDKVGLYDTLRAVSTHQAPATDITRCWQSIEGMSQHMLNFLENHDEQRMASAQVLGDPYHAIPALVVSATMSKAAFMIYMGQELGEKAEDAEGYSGNDGRTTIFDYWSVPTIRRWYCNGKTNFVNFTKKEKDLRKFYSRLLNLCNSEPAITLGGFFDLMYVNTQNLDPRYHYAYLRHYKGTLALVVANFSDQAADIALNIPQHAFQCASIRSGKVSCINLIDHRPFTANLSPDEPFHLNVSAWDALVLRIEPQISNILNR